MDISNERSFPTPYANSTLLPMLLMSLAVQKHSPSTTTEFQNEYDYIVVGAGAAGSVVARRLTEKSCVSVLLLEAGKAPPRLTDVPGLARNFWQTDVDWQYLTTSQRYSAAGLVDRKVTWPSGKALGGSTVFNGMIYIRGNRRNYDEWAALGAEGWSYKDVLPYFKKLEDNTDPEYLNTEFHASGGPITVSRPAYNPEAKLVTIEAARDEGFELVDPNAKEQIGFYDSQAALRRGQRCGTAKAYLVPAENRTNLDILPNAMVIKIIIEDKRAVGVEFEYDGSIHNVTARREVIVSTGTVKTAQLLMLSGIGPMSELMKHKIPLVADLPVGLNFQDHPASFVLFELDSRIATFEEELQNEDNVQEYINNRTGPLAALEGLQLMSFIHNPNINDDELIPDYTLYFADFIQMVPFQINLSPEVIEKVVLPNANKTTIYCASQLLRPKSVGSVTIESTDPNEQPVIDPNYFQDFRDIENMVQGFKTCMRIFSNPAMKQIDAKPLNVVVPGCEDYIADAELYLRCIVRVLTFTTSHPVGTARMGNPKDPRTVVDPQLRVKGIEGLRIVDASIMPTIPWSNTNIPTIMVAEKASDIIKETIQCDE